MIVNVSCHDQKQHRVRNSSCVGGKPAFSPNTRDSFLHTCVCICIIQFFIHNLGANIACKISHEKRTLDIMKFCVDTDAVVPRKHGIYVYLYRKEFCFLTKKHANKNRGLTTTKTQYTRAQQPFSTYIIILTANLHLFGKYIY